MHSHVSELMCRFSFGGMNTRAESRDVQKGKLWIRQVWEGHGEGEGVWLDGAPAAGWECQWVGGPQSGDAL